MQSVFGIAKTVNGRRAASAYHLLPGTSQHSSASPSNDQQQKQQQQAAACAGDAPLAALKASPSSSLTSSLSSSSLSSLGAMEAAASSGSSSRRSTPTHASAEFMRLHSSPFMAVSSADASEELQQDWHVSKHGSAVDKTNPFIGYFQTGRDAPPAPMGLPPRSVSGAAAVATPYSTLLTQPKRIAGWIGSQSTRLPSLFSKREQGGDKQQPQVRDAAQDQQKQDGDGNEEVKGMSLLSSLRAAANALGAGSRKDSSKQQQTSGALSPIAAHALSAAASSSRFAQDFELVESLGQGGQGTVFKARSKVDGCFYAIKKVTLSPAALDDPAELEQARREAVSMAAIPPHSNVVRYHTAWIEVETIERMTSSTASVRGSDVPNDDDELELVSGSEHSSEDLDDNDASFSLDSLPANLEDSFGGFEFEDPSQSMMSFMHDQGEDMSSSNSNAGRAKLTGVGKSKLTLYIQMELCSTSAASAAREEETFDRFVDRLKQKASPPPQEQYSNLTQWLRSSVNDRSYSAQAACAAKHAEGLKLFLGVAQGVSHMHSVGIIHRDLKPDNIFIHGEVAKVGDFGLSKSIFADSKNSSQQRACGSSGSATEYGDHTTALGTFTYASPEQLGHRFNKSKDTSRVKSAKYSVKSDIFALGVILLELCCPFSTMMERSQVLTAVRHGVVPQKALQRYPTEMALVLRMTAVDPAERPTADEICEQIRSLLPTQSAVSARSALDEIRDLQAKLALAVHQLRDRSQAALQLESLVAEMNDKIQSIGVALA